MANVNADMDMAANLAAVGAVDAANINPNNAPAANNEPQFDSQQMKIAQVIAMGFPGV